jgi:hypothetical protein
MHVRLIYLLLYITNEVWKRFSNIYAHYAENQQAYFI